MVHYVEEGRTGVQWEHAVRGVQGVEGSYIRHVCLTLLSRFGDVLTVQ